MIIGTIKETKNMENRVGLTPEGAQQLTQAGHTVLVETKAGEGSGFSDDQYKDSGATICDTPQQVVEQIDILVKVKEPQASEYELLGSMKGKTLYTYLHLAACDPKLTETLVEHSITGIGYETVKGEDGGLPLLLPMSEVAGVLAVEYGAEYLQKKYGGKGTTLGIIHGAEPAEVLVIGAGTVGTTAARTAAGMGCNVTLVDINEERLKHVEEEVDTFLGENLAGHTHFILSDPEKIRELLKKTDLLIGAVLVPGAKAPTVVSEEDAKLLEKGSVVIDVAIDQGGCIWGSKPTSHAEPIYMLNEVVYCCVTNMPSQAALQSTVALTAATMPHLLEMANTGVDAYLEKNELFRHGLQTQDGFITNEHIAKDLDMMDKLRPAH